MINTIEQLEEVKDIFSEEDYNEYENLIYISQSEDAYSAEWYTTKDMQNKILAKYGLSSSDPYGMGYDEQDDERYYDEREVVVVVKNIGK